MFLLIHIACLNTGREFVFTFHNVSINTNKRPEAVRRTCNFTFHNVSINTLQAKKDERIAILFTFHNVSINTS